MLSTCVATFVVYTPIYRAASSLTISWWFTLAMYSRSIRIGEGVSLFVFPCRSVSLGTTVLAHRTTRADHTITRSLAQLNDHSHFGAMVPSR